jgi:Ala-tRNA(Pro) deacylase
MAISNVVKFYLDLKGVPFDLRAHPITGSTSHQTAIAAHIEEDHLAKAVLLKRDWEYLMVVVPADRTVKLDSIAMVMGQSYEVAPKTNAEALLKDCKPGAIPPVGHAYGVQTLVDSSLDNLSDIYFEAGDHEHLVHVDRANFQYMFSNCQHGNFSSYAN